MIASARDDKVVLRLSWNDPSEYLPALNELIEANEDVEAHRSELSSWQLGPMLGRVAAAEVEVDELFTETLSIEQAQRLHNALYAALIEAKVHAQVFAYTDGD